MVKGGESLDNQLFWLVRVQMVLSLYLLQYFNFSTWGENKDTKNSFHNLLIKEGRDRVLTNDEELTDT